MGFLADINALNRSTQSIDSVMDSLPDSFILSAKDLPYLTPRPQTLLERAEDIVDHDQALSEAVSEATRAAGRHAEFVNDAHGVIQSQTPSPEQDRGAVLDSQA